MRTRTIAILSGAALALAACSGGETTETADEGAEGAEESAEAATYDPASPEGMAYRAAVECSATMAASSDLRGSQGVFMEGEELEALRAEEEERDAEAETIAAVAAERGEALGLAAADVEAEIAEHQGTFVQGPEDGSMEEFAARVASDADECAAEYSAE